MDVCAGALPVYTCTEEVYGHVCRNISHTEGVWICAHRGGAWTRAHFLHGGGVDMCTQRGCMDMCTFPTRRGCMDMCTQRGCMDMCTFPTQRALTLYTTSEQLTEAEKHVHSINAWY